MWLALLVGVAWSAERDDVVVHFVPLLPPMPPWDLSGGAVTPEPAPVLATPPEAPVAAAEPQAPVAPSQPSFDLFTPMPIKHKPRPLETDDAIVGMIKTTLERETPTLHSCYVPRLPEVPALAGTWQVDLVVEPDGTVTNVKIAGIDSADPPLEACIAERVAGWDFLPVNESQTVTKRVTFGPPAELGAIEAAPGLVDGSSEPGP